MKISKIFLIVFFCTGSLFPEKPYEGDIRESDLRVEELRNQLMNTDSEVPTMRLKYSGQRGNYLAFYDLKGAMIYYRFREDRFDDRRNQILQNLIEGQAYGINGRLLGCELGLKLFQKQVEKFDEVLKNKNCILVFDYIDSSPLRMEQILFP